MRLIDGSGERLAADVGVSLVPGDAFFSPIGNEAAGLLGGGHLGHHRRVASTRYVRTGKVHARAGHRTAVNATLHVDLVVGRCPSGSADGRDTAGEVQTRRAELELHAPSARGVKRVVVQPHHPRNDGVSRKIHHAGAVRHAHRRRRADGGNASILDQHCLPFPRARARAVDHANVRQCDHRLGHSHVLPHLLRQRRVRLCADNGRHHRRGQQQCTKQLHRPSHGALLICSSWVFVWFGTTLRLRLRP